MSVLNFTVTGQQLVRNEELIVVASSREYLSTAFIFSQEWDDCTKTAVFRKASDEAFSVFLDENNSCVVPWEVIACPHFTVSVFGVCGDERITTNQVVVKVEVCGYGEGKTPEDPTPSVYEEIINKLDSVSGFTGDYNDLTNKPTKLSEFENDENYINAESDPIFKASPAYGITSEDIEKWSNGSGFDGDYNNLTNKPSKLSDFENDENYISEEADPVFAASPAAGIKAEDIEKWNSGGSDEVLPIEKGGTGATTVEQAWQNLKIYTDVSQLGLSFKTTCQSIYRALPAGAIGMFPFESKFDTITDAPCNKGIIAIFNPVKYRPLLLCQQCVSTGSAHAYFYVGYANSTYDNVTWYRIFNGDMTASIKQGGTGANTAEKALQNLGAAKSADIGDVTTLATTDKTVVGAINEMQAGIGDVETALTAIIGGAE